MTDEAELAELIEQRFEKEGLDDHEPTFAAIAAEVAQQFYKSKMNACEACSQRIAELEKELFDARELLCDELVLTGTLTNALEEIKSETNVQDGARFDTGDIRDINEIAQNALEAIPSSGQTPCPVCPHWTEVHNEDGSCGCGLNCAALEKGK